MGEALRSSGHTEFLVQIIRPSPECRRVFLCVLPVGGLFAASEIERRSGAPIAPTVPLSSSPLFRSTTVMPGIDVPLSMMTGIKEAMISTNEKILRLRSARR